MTLWHSDPLLQRFNDLHLYQVSNDDTKPHQRLDSYIGDGTLPFDISFPANPDGEVILKWEYYDLETCNEFLEMTIEAELPLGWFLFLYHFTLTVMGA